jgi:dienelactone hydrolase
MKQPITATEVHIATDGVSLAGDLRLPAAPQGVVVFAHGSGSSRYSPRNRQVAATLNSAGLATLLVDLLTSNEDDIDRITRELRFNMELLRRRLDGIVKWVASDPAAENLSIGCFGASTGAAGALLAAADNPELVKAVVSRGGRPDLAADRLPSVKAPTLLIVGGDDTQVIELNRQALELITAEKRLDIIPGASHLFEEPGTLEEVARLSAEWFLGHLGDERTGRK